MNLLAISGYFFLQYFYFITKKRQDLLLTNPEGWAELRVKYVHQLKQH